MAVVTSVVAVVNGSNQLIFFLTDSSLYLYSSLTNTITLIQAGFNPPAGFSRWAVYSHSTGLYFTNLYNDIKWFDLTTVWDLVSHGELTQVPPLTPGTYGPHYQGKYIENFYNHLVVANLSDGISLYPNRVAFSDVLNFPNFAPTVTNEADYYDLETPATTDLGLGVTGLKRLGDLCIIYTEDSIYNMAYVGFNNGVMQLQQQIDSLGCTYPYSLVALNRLHYFIGLDDFWTYDGVSVQSIGDDIRDYFFNDVSSNLQFSQRTYGSVDTSLYEITWRYCSNQSTGEYDKAVVFNYKESIWYPIEGRNVSAFLSKGGSTYVPIDLLNTLEPTIGTLGNYTPTIAGLNVSVATPVLFGKDLGDIYTEAAPGDATSLVVEESDPYLESGDIFYGDAQMVKEIDTIYIDAGWAEGSCLQVWVSSRDFISSPLNYQLVGNWTPGLLEQRLSGVRTVGRIYRFKFIFKGLQSTGKQSRAATFVMFGENVYGLWGFDLNAGLEER
jgi:hypothetical protein